MTWICSWCFVDQKANKEFGKRLPEARIINSDINLGYEVSSRKRAQLSIPSSTISCYSLILNYFFPDIT